MKWIKISERLPVGCKHRMFWDTKNKIEVFRAYDQADPMLNKLPPQFTHWLEISGPEEDFCEWKFNDDEWGNAFDDYVTSCGGVRRCKR